MKKNGFEEYFVYGFHTVISILIYQPNRAIKLFLARKEHGEALDLAKKAHVPVEYLERSDLERKFGVSSDAQGIVLLCKPFSYITLPELLDSNPHTLVVLDSLQDNINIGRIARGAVCFGADGMILTKDRSALVNKTAEKASVGALSRFKVAQVTNLASSIKSLKDAGFFIYGASEDGSIELKDADFAKKSAIVIGQEGEGLRELTRKNCDLLIKIPMKNDNICLNAADASLLFLYQLSIRR